MLQEHIKEFVVKTLLNGWCTMSVSGNTPKSGYMVSIDKTCERQYTELLNIYGVSNYCGAYHKELYEHDNTYLSSYTHNSTVFLSVSVNVSNLDDAVELLGE